METEIVCVSGFPTRAKPRRPAQAPRAVQHECRDFVPSQHQSNVPIELEREIKPDPVSELSEQRTSGQEAFVFPQRQGADANAELVLAIPHPAAHHGAGAKRRALTPEKRALALAKRHPVRHELFDAHRHAEIVLQNAPERFGTADMTDERTGVKQLRLVGDGVAMTEHRGSYAEH